MQRLPCKAPAANLDGLAASPSTHWKARLLLLHSSVSSRYLAFLRSFASSLHSSQESPITITIGRFWSKHQVWPEWSHCNVFIWASAASLSRGLAVRLSPWVLGSLFLQLSQWLNVELVFAQLNSLADNVHYCSQHLLKAPEAFEQQLHIHCHSLIWGAFTMKVHGRFCFKITVMPVTPAPQTHTKAASANTWYWSSSVWCWC